MKYEKRHWAYVQNKGGASVPSERMVNDLGDMMEHYIGTFSEYNPLYIERFGNLSLIVRKNTSIKSYKEDFECAIHPEDLGGIHSTEFNCNGGIILTRKQLLKIAFSMDEGDTLLFLNPDTVNRKEFEKKVKH